jgi:hypothetical protein
VSPAGTALRVDRWRTRVPLPCLLSRSPSARKASNAVTTVDRLTASRAASSRSAGRRSPAANRPWSIARRIASASLRCRGPGPSDQAPSAASMDWFIPMVPELAMDRRPNGSQSTFQSQPQLEPMALKLDCDHSPTVCSRRKEGQVESMSSFLAEERMHTLRRDGALVHRSRRRAWRRRPMDALTSRFDDRSARNV